MTINFERAATLMDVVQKVASVAPAYTALSGVAMGELKKMNEEAQEHLSELGRQRLKEEQVAAARLAENNRLAAEEQAAQDAKAQQLAQRPKPIAIMPGEPVPDAVRAKADEIPETDTPQFPDDTAPVTRRV